MNILKRKAERLEEYENNIFGARSVQNFRKWWDKWTVSKLVSNTTIRCMPISLIQQQALKLQNIWTMTLLKHLMDGLVYFLKETTNWGDASCIPTVLKVQVYHSHSEWVYLHFYLWYYEISYVILIHLNFHLWYYEISYVILIDLLIRDIFSLLYILPTNLWIISKQINHSEENGIHPYEQNHQPVFNPPNKAHLWTKLVVFLPMGGLCSQVYIYIYIYICIYTPIDKTQIFDIW